MRSRLKEERHQLILATIQENGRATVAELTGALGVSEATIRRDLRHLAVRRLLRRAHGGALLPIPSQPEAPVVQRMLRHQPGKEGIGRAAAGLVPDGASVFIGSGSTTAYVARNLVDREGMTVVTNALTVAGELAGAEGVSVVVTGGAMRASELSLVGHITEQSLREVRVDKVIMGMQAISLDQGMTNDYLPEVMTDRAIIEMASELIVVADHSKFGQVASAYIAPVERITTLVTDSGADPEVLASLRATGVQVIVADT